MTTPNQPRKLGLTPQSVAAQARRARATGEPVPRPEPPAGSAEPDTSIKRVGFPSIRPGEVVEATDHGQVDQHFYTTEEVEAMTAKGWTPGTDVRPEEVAGVMAELEAAANLPPIDPAAPKYTFKTHEMSDLPPDKQAEFKAAIESYRSKRAEMSAAAAEQRRASQTPPSVRKAVAEGRKADKGQRLEVVPDDKKPQAEPPEVKPQQPAPPVSETGATAHNATCPNCGHPQDQNPGEPPPMEDRLAFVESVMANRRYRKAYKCYGGKLVVTVRELAPEEADVVFLTARKGLSGDASALDVLEVVARLRACLQIVSVISADGGTNVEGRGGLSPELCPGALDFWCDNYAEPVDPQAPPQAEGGSPWDDPSSTSKLTARLVRRRDYYSAKLLEVQELLNKELFTGEGMYRIVADSVRNFNRELARLVDNAHNPDFLEPAAK